MTLREMNSRGWQTPTSAMTGASASIRNAGNELPASAIGRETLAHDAARRDACIHAAAPRPIAAITIADANRATVDSAAWNPSVYSRGSYSQ